MGNSSKVYFMGPRAPTGNVALSYVAKGQRIFDAAGLNECFKKGDRVAIKVHCGEWNNTGYLRPSIVAGIVEKVKEYGGDPFVTDTTTLIYGSKLGRVLAQDMYKTAARNGYTEATLGCPFVVADGDYGLDDVKVRVDGNFLNYAYIARAIADADAMIAVTHFKGHTTGVYGGAIKNLGIGCTSKRGKTATHMMTSPLYGIGATWPFHPEKCRGKDCISYQTCLELCPVGAVKLKENAPYIEWDRKKCVGCGSHWFLFACGVSWYPPDYEYACPAAFADSAAAVVKLLGKEHVGYINFAIDISPWCDCASNTDSWLLPNLGVFASKDLVAIDKACLDAADKAPAVPGSKAYDKGFKDEPWKEGHEKFTYVSTRYPEVSQWIQVNSARSLGLGSTEYELVEVEPGSMYLYVPPQYRDHPTGYALRKRFRIETAEPDLAAYRKKPKVDLNDLKKKP